MALPLTTAIAMAKNKDMVFIIVPQKKREKKAFSHRLVTCFLGRCSYFFDPAHAKPCQIDYRADFPL
ncbi:hypothetical protein [Candidatus Accumulibacter phosphatis]|uniref:hypothetical protein n=1 Tax=Candidatus Accumulibacter phosphatis TaxID=327160 RepID=UPI00145CE033|nr:hypothetical protein [Candidatus Accumulibacter phosphatis]